MAAREFPTAGGSAATGQTAIGAIDIGGTKIAVALLAADGSILTKDEMPTDAARGFEVAMAGVCATLRSAIHRQGVELRGVGIGCTGPVDPFSGRIGSVEFLLGWNGCSPVDYLSAEFRVDVALENDADAAALAEAAWGAGRGSKSLISVTVGTGIGGGILLGGELYRGAQGLHPEVGHHVIDPSGPQCFCGASGCWEALASAPAMVSRFLADRPGGTQVEGVTAMSICARARQADAAALHAVAIEARYLGLGIANLITLFAPEAIVLSGNVMNSADLLLPGIRAVVEQSCGLVPASATRLAVSALGPEAPVIGAGAVWNYRIGRELRQC